MTRKLLVALTAVTALAAATGVTPPTGYRQWFHVNASIVDSSSPLFSQLGGLHNIYLNAKGLPALQRGGAYPDGSVFADDIHDFSKTNGTYVEGNRKAVAAMEKDAKKYAATGGWGYQLWLGGDPAKPAVTDPVKQCFACHASRKANDYVFSTYLP